MLTLGTRVRIHVAAEAVDLRKGFDTLAAATRAIIPEDPLAEHWFVFLSRRQNRLKVLVWEPSAWLMPCKRLERGRLHLSTTPGVGARHAVIEATEPGMMMEGISLRGARRRARWEPQRGLALVSRARTVLQCARSRAMKNPLLYPRPAAACNECAPARVYRQRPGFERRAPRDESSHA